MFSLYRSLIKGNLPLVLTLASAGEPKNKHSGR